MSDRALVDRFEARVLADPQLGRAAHRVVAFRSLHTDSSIVRALDSLAAHWAAVREETSWSPTPDSSTSCTTS